MKKLLLLVLAEIAILIGVVLAANIYFFGAMTPSPKPLFFMAKLSFSSKFRLIPFSYLIKLACIGVVITVQFVFMYQKIRKSFIDIRNSNTHSQGTARWATEKEMRKAGMYTLSSDSIIIGQSADARGEVLDKDLFKITLLGKNLIADSTPYHTLVVGATGSGKGVGVIIPTLLTWKESVIVIDPKGESHEITGGFRSTFSEVFYFNPMDAKSCHINPLDFIPRDNKAVSKIRNICLIMHPNQSKDAYWDSVPRQMLEMMIGHVLVKGKNKSLTEVSAILNTKQSYAELFKGILKEYQDELLDAAHPLFAVAENTVAFASQFYQMATGQNAEQLVTHITAVRSDLSAYSTPEAIKALSYSDFALEDISDGKRPISLFFCCDVDNLPQLMPMFKLIYSLALRSLLHQQKHNHKLLLVLDEFSQFKKFEIIQEQIPFVRSYGIRIMAFIQSVAQLHEHYGHDGTNALLDNFQLKVYLKATAPETGDFFEKMLGKKTILSKKTSLSSNRRSVGVDGWTESTSEIGRPLLTSNEILSLPPYQEIIFRPNIYPYLGIKVQYYSDKRFSSRTKLPILNPELQLKLPEQPRAEEWVSTPEERNPFYPDEEESTEPKEERTLAEILRDIQIIRKKEAEEEMEELMEEEEKTEKEEEEVEIDYV